MFGIGIIEMAVLAAVPLAVGALLLGAAGAGRRRVRAGREWRVVVALRLLGGVVGVAGAWALAAVLDQGRGLVLAPAVAGLGIVVGVALGETVVRPRRAPGPRSASLRPRTARAYVPRPLSTTLAALLVFHVGTLVLTTFTATGGRSFTCRVENLAGSHGPYPGSYYSVPLLGMLALVGLVAVVAARVVVARPRGFAPDEQGDDVLRARSLTVIVAASGLALAATHVGIGIATAASFASLVCAPLWAERAAPVMALSVLLAFAIACWCAVRLLLTDRVGAREQVASR